MKRFLTMIMLAAALSGCTTAECADAVEEFVIPAAY